MCAKPMTDRSGTPAAATTTKPTTTLQTERTQRQKKKFLHLPFYPIFILHISSFPVASLSPESFVFRAL